MSAGSRMAVPRVLKPLIVDQKKKKVHTRPHLCEPQTHYVAKDDLKFLITLSLHVKIGVCHHIQCYEILGILFQGLAPAG